MKKGIKILLLFTIAMLMTGCGNKYKGYWCNYEETSTILVLLEHDNTAKDREAIEAKIASFENVASSNYYSREDYAEEIGENTDNLDIYATYFIVFSSMDSIGTYVKELQELSGVKSAEQNSAKSNMSLYNIKSWGKYTYTNSDEATEKDLETGKYKIKRGVISFTPKGDGETKLLYTKNGLICGDAECNKIYAKSTSTCTPIQNEE